METTRRWFNKFKSNDKMKSEKNKETTGVTKEGSRPPTNEEAPSNVTKQRVEAAKQYIENHYKKQMQSLQERKERRNMLEKKLADAEVSEEEQHNLLQHLEKKEREIMRLQRHKMGADDFEPLTMIGKGAFGEVEELDLLSLLERAASFYPSALCWNPALTAAMATVVFILDYFAVVKTIQVVVAIAFGIRAVGLFVGFVVLSRCKRLTG